MKSRFKFYLAAVFGFVLTLGIRAQPIINLTSVSSDVASAKPGDNVVFTVTLTNAASAPAGGGTANDFPGGVGNFTITLTSNTADTITFTPASQSLAIPAITAGGSGTVQVTRTIPRRTSQAASYFINATVTGGVSGSTSTPTPSFAVIGRPDLQITSLVYPAGTAYVGGDVIPMSLTYVNNDLTPAGDGNPNVPYVPGRNGPAFVRIQVVLSSNPTYGDADDFRLTLHDIVDLIDADNAVQTVAWNQVLPGNFTGSYYVLAKIDSLDALDENDPAPLTVNGDNVWGGNSLNPSGTLINLLPKNFPTVYLSSHGYGAATTASGYSDNPSMTADGRYVAFASDAANLLATPPDPTPHDTNGVRDIFLFDSQTNLVRRLSVSQQGVQGNAASNNPSISSGNGRYVAFESNANNLVVGDTNGFSDIFVVDTITGLIARVSGINAAGSQANNPSFKPSISQTGRYVVYQSSATNLTAGGTVFGVSHVYLHDRDVSGSGIFDTPGNTSTRIVDVDAGSPLALAGNGSAIQATISADGTWVAFASQATNLVTLGTTPGRQHVYVRPVANLGTATSGIKLVSVAHGTGVPGGADSQTPSLSANGRYVAFASLASNLIGAADTNGISDIFIYDNAASQVSPIVTRVSVTATGGQASDPSSVGFKLGSINPTLSADGRYVAFASLASNLTAGNSVGQASPADANEALDIFVHDRQVSGAGALDVAGNTTTTMVSVNPFGYQTNGLLGVPSTAASNIYPVISANGRFVAFPSDAENVSGFAFGATNLLPLDSNGLRDVFLFDRRTDAPVTPATPPTVTLTNPGNGAKVLVNTAVSLTASATTSLGVVSTVQFFVNGTSLGTSSVFPYSQTWTPTAVGLYTLSALVTDSFGNIGVSPNVQVTVNAAPSVGITAPVAGAPLVVGVPQTVTASAAASNPGATIAEVQFFVDGIALDAADPTAPYSVSWTPLATGSYTLTAMATDSLGTSQTSPGVTVTVSLGGSGAGQLPTASVTWPAANTALPVNRTLNVTAGAEDADGNIVSVEFFAGKTSLGIDTIYPYTVPWTPTSLGNYALTVKAIDSDGNAVTSAPRNVRVIDPTPNPPVISLASPSNASTVSAGSAQTLRVNAADAVSVQSVQFFVNDVAVGPPDTIYPFEASWTPTAPGNYIITARAVNTSGHEGMSGTVLVLVTDTSAESIFSGTYLGLGETGSFSLIAGSSGTAVFLAHSTTPGANKAYRFLDIPMDVAGGYSVAGSAGQLLLSGSTGATGTSGTFDLGRLTFIGVDTSLFPASKPVAAGRFTGTVTGKAASSLTGLVGADGSILLYVEDGAFRDAGSGKVDAAGGFNFASARGNRFTGKADPVTFALTGNLSGTNGGAFSGARVDSGAPSGDKVGGLASEVGSNIVLPTTGKTYDQVLLEGSSASITADPGQVTRLSYIDLSDDIVQVEFSGAGRLSIELENAAGPMLAANYNQPGTAYMKGHAGIVITGADETTNVSIFSVGTITALNQALFRSDVAYDGVADLAYLVIVSKGASGKFGGLRAANANFVGAKGMIGVVAPGVEFVGPVFVGDINTDGAGNPMLLLGSAGKVQINGGSLWQQNLKAVQVSGVSRLEFVDGMTSRGTLLPAQIDQSRLEENGIDVTTQIVVNPGL